MEIKQKRVAIYARTAVSQDHTNTALEHQVEQCKAYCRQCGYVVEESHIYREEGNGLVDYKKCPQLGEVLRLAAAAETTEKEQNPPFDKLIIHSFDRLSRDQAQATAIIAELERHGITVESVDGHNLNDLSKFIQAIDEQVEQIRRMQMSRRIKCGKATKKAQQQ